MDGKEKCRRLRAMRERIEGQENLSVFQQAVDDLIVENGRVAGIVTQTGFCFSAQAVVLCAGTFLNGMVHIGLEHYQAGRVGDPASVRLAERLKDLGMPSAGSLLGIIIFTGMLNLLITSATSKWAILSTIFVPMLMMLGISPELTQAAFRVSDSAVNVCTPMFPFYPLGDIKG